MSELGLTIDYSPYENFVKVLSNTESTESEVKDAFDALATSITDAGLSGAEDFETMKAALEDLGVINNGIIAFQALVRNSETLEKTIQSAGLTMDEFVISTEDGTIVASKAAQAFIAEMVGAENCGRALALLQMQHILINENSLNTTSDINACLALAKSAGVAVDSLSWLANVSAQYDAAVAAGDTVAQQNLSATMESIKDKIKSELANFTPDKVDVDFSSIENKAEESASSTLKSFTDLLDKELNVLDKKMEAGYIDFNDYIQSRLALIEDYYRQGRLSADEYYSYLEQHYDKQLSYMDKAINAVTRRIDKEIDGLEKQKDEIEQNYQLQIDYLNEQKTLLEDANKERQRQINLQKALYELERAKNQRTMLIYSEDKGLHYVADDTAIKDAQQEVENAEFDIQIADIESSISKLEEARDIETAAIDAMIEKLQEYKEQWNDITSAYEEEQEDLIAAQIFGQEWESEILDGRLDTLNRFKDDYIKIQQAMVDATYEAAKAMANQEKITIGDSEHGYEVIDEKTATRVGNGFSSEKQAKDYAKKLNEQKAKENGMTPAQFNNSDIPGYYVKKYHTGLRQGPVKQHSFDEDFKLIRRAGLGAEEVPAILKVGEAVATPEQIHNLADSIRQSAMPNLLISPSSNYPFAQNIDRIASSPTQQIINQNITLNCPNVTNHSGVEYIQRELGHLSLRALQESRKR